jgi:hypothetical protein
MLGDIIECQECKNRFFDTRTWDEIEKKLCLFCNNQDKYKTIVLGKEQLKNCNCHECKTILNKLKKDKHD